MSKPKIRYGTLLTRKYTYGDDQELQCPHCSYKHCFQDWLTDGWNGGEYECDECRNTFNVDIDYSVSLTASAKVEDK